MLYVVLNKTKPGISLIKLDKIAEEYIFDNCGIPAYKGMAASLIHYIYLLMKKFFMEYQMIIS